MAPRGQKKSERKVDLLMARYWRQTLRWALASVFLLLVGFGGKLGLDKLQDPEFLPLSVVRIDGDFKYLSRTQLEQAVSGVVTQNFFGVDLDAVKHAAQELSWVEQVTVRRVWPDTIEMNVVEQNPLARWGKLHLVSTKGVIFLPRKAEIPNGLPLLTGPDEAVGLVTKNYYFYRQRMNQLGLEISRMGADSRMAWSLVFKNKLEIKLGKDEPNRRLEKFSALYPVLQQPGDRPVLKVDLRYTNGAAVVWGDLIAPVQAKKRVDIPLTNIQIRHAHMIGRGQV